MLMDRLLSGDVPELSNWCPLWLRGWVCHWYWEDWTRVVAGRVVRQWHWRGRADPENMKTHYWMAYDLNGNELRSGICFSRKDACEQVQSSCNQWIREYRNEVKA